MVDTDCDGVISKSELLSLMRTMGVRTSEEKVAKVIQSENPEGRPTLHNRLECSKCQSSLSEFLVRMFLSF